MGPLEPARPARMLRQVNKQCRFKLKLYLPVEVGHPAELMYLVGPVFHLTRKLGWPEMP